MAVTLEQVGSGDADGNTTAELAFTGTIQPGELMVGLLQVAHFTTYSITTVPAGWSVVASLSALEFGVEANWDMYLYTKLAGASEPLTHQWVTTGSNCIVHGGRFSGLGSATPDEVDTEYVSGFTDEVIEGTSPDPGGPVLWFIGWGAKHFEAGSANPTFTDSGAAVTRRDDLFTTGGTKNESAWAYVAKTGTVDITVATGASMGGPRVLVAAFAEAEAADTDIDLAAGTGDGAAAPLDLTPLGILDLTPGSGEGAVAEVEVTPLPPPPPLTLVPGAAAGGSAAIRIRIPGSGTYDPGGADAVRRPPRPVR
jgi:hypothetical protein